MSVFTQQFEKLSRTRIQVRFMLFCGIFGIIAFTAYSVINFVIGDYPIAFVEAGLAVYTITVTIVTLRTSDLRFARTYGLLPLVIISVHNFISGGFLETGILWCYTFPLLATFISGRTRGAFSSISFLIFTLLFYLLDKAQLTNSFIYEDFYYFMFVISFGIIAFLTYVFQAAWDVKEISLEKERSRLALSIEKQEKIQEELEEVLAELAERATERKET